MHSPHHAAPISPEPPGSRRKFFQALAASGGGLFASSCATISRGGISVGSGDTGIMNFAYALEQMEAEYYSQVMQRPYAGMSRAEAQVLRDIRDHELVHRDFFRRVLGSRAIPLLRFDFSSVDFNSRNSVLMTSMMFEDNGSGNNIQDPNVLTVAGKIVSVEARQASAIRSLLYPGSNLFAPTALDNADQPRTALRKVSRFFVTPVDVSSL